MFSNGLEQHAEIRTGIAGCGTWIGRKRLGR
jgi:hypothetical protein